MEEISMAGKKLTLKPLNGFLVVEPMENGGKLLGGLLLSVNSQEKAQKGAVLAAGTMRTNGGKQIEMAVKPGDVVMYPRFSGTEIKFDHRKLVILSEGDILAVMDN
jgi:chaperonin GroES